MDDDSERQRFEFDPYIDYMDTFKRMICQAVREFSDKRKISAAERAAIAARFLHLFWNGECRCVHSFVLQKLLFNTYAAGISA